MAQHALFPRHCTFLTLRNSSRWETLYPKSNRRVLMFISAHSQRQTYPEEGFQVREQVRQAPEKGCRIQLPQPTQGGEEEGIHTGGRRQGGKVWRSNGQNHITLWNTAVHREKKRNTFPNRPHTHTHIYLYTDTHTRYMNVVGTTARPISVINILCNFVQQPKKSEKAEWQKK